MASALAFTAVRPVALAPTTIAKQSTARVAVTNAPVQTAAAFQVRACSRARSLSVVEFAAPDGPIPNPNLNVPELTVPPPILAPL